MKNIIVDEPSVIELRPSPVFAILKVLPFIGCAFGFLWLALRFFPVLVLPALACVLFALYRYWYIRTCRYLLTEEIIRITRGICFKRTDQVELYRLKDYIIYRPFLLQLLGLMDLELKGTDPENPVIWLRGIPYSAVVDIIRERVQAARKHNQIVELN